MPQDRDKSNSRGWAHQEMLCLLPTDPAAFFLPPQRHPFFQQGKCRRTGTKVTAGGWAHQEMLCLLPADPAGFFLSLQGHPFFQQGKRRRTGTKVTAGGLGASGKLARTQARIQDWPPGRRPEGGRDKDVESARSAR
ncbi:hypothetical protein CWN47_30230 [Klebsiella variicola]|uniref:Uncharacterized protein n=1 Tax=Klebsiella variicola TaxID=244366 RepID=A0A2N4YSM3_KLEVA|nr:hypothetical protein CWN47_30230 [Klebsiella variicola]